MVPFMDRVQGLAAVALPSIQKAYDEWQPVKPGAGLCGVIMRKVEIALGMAGIRFERWSEDDHFYTVAFSDDDSMAVAIDLPWHFYEERVGEYNWMKVDGHIFTIDNFTFTTIA